MKDQGYENSYDLEKIELKAVDKSVFTSIFKYFLTYKWTAFFCLLALISAKAIESFVPIAIGNLTQKILETLNTNSDMQRLSFQEVLASGLFCILLLVFSYLLEALNVVLKSLISQRALNTLRSDVYNKILYLPIRYFENTTVGRLITRTIHDVDQIHQMFAESLIPIIGNVILFICIFIGIIWINYQIAFAIACLMPFVFFHINAFRKYQKESFRRVRVIVSAMNTFVQEHLMGISVIRKFGLVKHELKKFRLINKDLKKAYLETIHNFSFMTAGIDFATSLFLIIVFVVLALFSSQEGFLAGTYFTLSLYALMIFRPLSDLAERYNVLQSAIAAFERIQSVLNEQSEDVKEGEKTISSITSIVFEDVWFAYDHDNWVLKGLCLEIHKGLSAAFVGSTGAGKTTIISLLLRLYDFQKGKILINGIDIRKISKQNLRSLFALVSQEPFIFEGSLSDNITMYDRSLTQKDVEQAIHDVNLKESFNQKNQEAFYFLKEHGKGLSSGQMQLIALARAIACQKDVIILDEATANIDSKTEHALQKALKKVMQDKMTLIIAHRLSTIKQIDQIFVIHEGRVFEKGTHKELLKMKGIYEKLYYLQTEKGMII